MIPISDPRRQLTTIQDELLAAMKDVLLSGQYILGSRVHELEREIAERLEVTEAIGVGNGTDALILTLHAYGIGAGDEVITTPFTFFATAEAITRVGATPVFVDVDEQTFNLDPRKITDKLSASTKAILPVHLFGQPAAMDDINHIAKKYNLIVIEDACQAFGATYKEKEVGSLGDTACFSFFPTKNLPTIGDGGMITTSDSELANRIRSLRVHGSYKKYHHNEIGFNSRLDEIHAAVISTNLNYIDQWNEQRRKLASRYDEKLRDISSLKLPYSCPDSKHVYHLYCVGSGRREKVRAALEKHEISTGVYYPRCIHLQKAYAHLGYKQGDLPIAESLSQELFALPLYPGLTLAKQDYILATLKKQVSKR